MTPDEDAADAAKLLVPRLEKSILEEVEDVPGHVMKIKGRPMTKCRDIYILFIIHILYIMYIYIYIKYYIYIWKIILYFIIMGIYIYIYLW